MMQVQRATKGLVETVRRAALLPIRYGLGSNRIGIRVERMVGLMDRWEARPTIPITASVLDRHAGVLTHLAGADLAIHGYRQRSYADLTFDEQASDVDQAISAFARHGLTTSGFRAPYLGTNAATYRLLRSRRFTYDSSRSTFFLSDKDPTSSDARFLATKRYGQLPQRRGVSDYLGLIQFSVALPDDEILVDGLGIRGTRALSRILLTMADQATASAEHLVLQVHPERFDILSGALEILLQEATDNGAWIPSLAEAAEWILSGRGASGRWPRGAPFAVSVTGDLDALSLADFGGRTREG